MLIKKTLIHVFLIGMAMVFSIMACGAGDELFSSDDEPASPSDEMVDEVESPDEIPETSADEALMDDASSTSADEAPDSSAEIAMPEFDEMIMSGGGGGGGYAYCQFDNLSVDTVSLEFNPYFEGLGQSALLCFRLSTAQTGTPFEVSISLPGAYDFWLTDLYFDMDTASIVSAAYPGKTYGHFEWSSDYEAIIGELEIWWPLMHREGYWQVGLTQAGVVEAYGDYQIGDTSPILTVWNQVDNGPLFPYDYVVDDGWVTVLGGGFPADTTIYLLFYELLPNQGYDFDSYGLLEQQAVFTDEDGVLLASVEKELDFGTYLIKGLFEADGYWQGATEWIIYPEP